MSLEEKIIRNIQELSESKKAEVLDFVEYLRGKTEERGWSEFSLTSAMRGMERRCRPIHCKTSGNRFDDYGGPLISSEARYQLSAFRCQKGLFSIKPDIRSLTSGLLQCQAVL
jgi:hypothetical protein